MNENEKLENQEILEEMAAEEQAELQETSKNEKKKAFGLGGLIVGGVLLIGGAIAYVKGKKKRNAEEDEFEEDPEVEIDYEDADFWEVDDPQEGGSGNDKK